MATPGEKLADMRISLFRISLTFVCTFIVAAELHGQDRLTGQTFATRSEVIAENGMVTHHPLAGQIALDILKQGGALWMLPLQPMRFWGLPTLP